MHPSLSTRVLSVPVASVIVAAALSATPAQSAGSKKAPRDNSRVRDTSLADTLRHGDTTQPRRRAPDWNDTVPGARPDTSRVPIAPGSPTTAP